MFVKRLEMEFIDIAFTNMHTKPILEIWILYWRLQLKLKNGCSEHYKKADMLQFFMC